MTKCQRSLISFVALTLLSPALTLAKSNPRLQAAPPPIAPVVEEKEPTIDSLYMNQNDQIRGPASEEWPEELGREFVVTEPDRSPASVRPTSPTHKPQAVAKPLSRRSRLPAAVSDGFELRVRYNKLTTMFWVVKRDAKYDLLFANSGGSRSSRSLNEDSFRALQEAASRLPASESNISKCKEASMQMHLVTAGKGERTTTMCVTEKGKAAEDLRNLSQSLAALVR